MSSSSKRAKTATEKKQAKNAGTIADVGLKLAPNESVYLKCDSLSSMLRVINITNERVELPACAGVQRVLGRTEITGDELPNHLPVGWGQAHQIRFEVVRINSDLAPGGDRELDASDLERISGQGQRWTMEELMDMVKPLPGSENKQNHYLGYRRSLWRPLKHQTLQTKVEADIVLDVVRGTSLDTPYDCNRLEMAVLVPEALHGASVAFVVPKTNTADATKPTKLPKDEPLDTFMKSIGTSGCVSLLQKIIRRRPAALLHPDTDETIEAPRVIAAVLRRLLDPQQPGIFLPDQGVYVSARQHLLKRLLVMMAEDSEYSDTNACLLASSALLLECEPSWEPPSPLQQQWETIAVELWRSPVTSEYDADKGLRAKLPSPVPFDEVAFPSLVLEELGGMRGDKGMMRWLQSHPRNTLRAENTTPSGVDSMNIYCDQHVTGNIVYLWCPRTERGPARMPFGPELEKAFYLVSGMNPRRRTGLVRTKEEKEHECAILTAMEEASKMFRGMPIPFPKPDSNTIEYEWDVPDGALAGMIGPIEIRVGGKVLVTTADPADLRRWVVIPKPSRNSNLKDITNEERKEGLECAADMFAKGVKLKSVPHSSLAGLVATFSSSDGKWKVGGVDWAEKKKVKFSLVRYPEWDTNYDDLPFECPREYSQEAIQWAAGRIGGYEPVVHMPTVARDGSGTKEALTGMETYSLLRQLSLKYPDALWPVGQFSFETKCIPLRLEIRERLLSSLKKTSSSVYPEWFDDRTLRPLQEEALEGMLKADAAGMGTFLWMLVGSGKSMTVLSFIHKTRRSRATLWCLPMSAMKSVASEIRRAGWGVRVLASSSGRLKQHDWASKTERTLDTTLQAGKITLVEHDDVRNLVTPLSPQMLSTTFVYDEVHKAMAAKTQRTGSALRLAQLAKQMVALTGTPIVDSRAFMLMKWLRFCVPFQVHSRNFWVAANSMIAKLTSTPVQIDRRNIIVPLSPEQTLAVDALLPPRLGGTARKPDYRRAYELSTKYVDEWLVDETMRVVYGERGDAPEGCPVGEGHAYAVAATRLLPPTETLFDHLPQRVLLVAADRSHGAALVHALISKGAPEDEIMFIGGRNRPDSLPNQVKHASSVCFTAEEWRRGEWVPNICVAPISFCEGYSLTWMTTMITGVYPSNQAKRTQMEGRINRANCERLHRTYITAMAGLTEVMYKYQRNAKNLESALANLSKMES